MNKPKISRLNVIYSNSPLDVQLRARTLQIINLVFLILIPAGAVFLNILQPRSLFAPMNIVLFMIFISFLASLIFLRRGRYFAAANLVAFICTAGLVALVFLNMDKGTVEFMSNLYYASAAILFTALFCRIGWIIGISMIWLGSTVTSYIFSLPLMDKMQQCIANGIFPDSSFSIVITFAVCVMLLKVNRDINRKVKEGAEENRRQYETLSEVLGSVKSSASLMASSSESISGSSKNFSDNAQTQAASAEEVTSTIEEVTASTEQIAERILQQTTMIGNLMKRIGELTESINVMEQRIAESVSYVNDIARMGKSGEESLSTMNTSMTRIQQSSAAMNGIIEIINDIADQINLLSLNAAIEAARAGDSGRGFAVVADEISKLAERTSSSVKEISRLIKENESELLMGMKNVSGIMEVLKEIASGVKSATEKMAQITAQMGEQLETARRVHGDAEDLDGMSKSIHYAADEQKNAVIEIMRAVVAINMIAQDYASGARNLADNSVQLASMADEMRTMVQRY
ncbi:MAG: hypothetical protein JXA20_16295 [Spirochaetes bacterium]|nr:hypothetical protein [Spirochaetota bacterium]